MLISVAVWCVRGLLRPPRALCQSRRQRKHRNNRVRNHVFRDPCGCRCGSALATTSAPCQFLWSRTNGIRPPGRIFLQQCQWTDSYSKRHICPGSSRNLFPSDVSHHRMGRSVARSSVWNHVGRHWYLWHCAPFPAAMDAGLLRLLHNPSRLGHHTSHPRLMMHLLHQTTATHCQS